MRRFRFTLAQLMALVILIGLGFAALRNANALWAGATYNLAILTVSVALVGACSRNERARIPWVGFGIAGGLGLLPLGPPTPLLYTLQPYINPGAQLTAYAEISHSLNVILLGCLGAIIGQFLAPNDERLHA
jgi:hypothetical protein